MTDIEVGSGNAVRHLYICGGQVSNTCRTFTPVAFQCSLCLVWTEYILNNIINVFVDFVIWIIDEDLMIPVNLVQTVLQMESLNVGWKSKYIVFLDKTPLQERLTRIVSTKRKVYFFSFIVLHPKYISKDAVKN